MMIRPVVFAVCVLFSLAKPNGCLAQFGSGGGLSVQIGPGGPLLNGFGAVDLEKTIDYWVERNNNKVTLQIDLYLQRVNEVCQLNENEAARLKLALEGVARRQTKSASLQIQEFAYQSGLVKLPQDHQEYVADIEVEEAEQDDEEEKETLVIFSASLKGDGVVALGAEFKKSFLEHPSWIATLEKNLTPEQLEAYRNDRRESNLRNLYLAIDVWVAALDAEILLSTEQSDSITKHIRRQLTPKVTSRYPTKVKEASEWVEQVYGQNDNSLGDLLKPEQTGLRQAIMFREPGLKASWNLPNH